MKTKKLILLCILLILTVYVSFSIILAPTLTLPEQRANVADAWNEARKKCIEDAEAKDPSFRRREVLEGCTVSTDSLFHLLGDYPQPIAKPQDSDSIDENGS